MRAGLVALWLLLGVAAPSWAENLSKADQAAIQGVIARQIEAFRQDDGGTAFGFASPAIQDQFGNPDRFLDMVRRAYPSVHRPRVFDFTGLLTGDGTVVQQVQLIGPNGEAELALYSMERDAAGLWRVSGCVLVRSARAGA